MSLWPSWLCGGDRGPSDLANVGREQPTMPWHYQNVDAASVMPPCEPQYGSPGSYGRTVEHLCNLFARVHGSTWANLSEGERARCCAIIPTYFQETLLSHEGFSNTGLRLKGGWESLLKDTLGVQCSLHMPPIISPTKLHTGITTSCRVFGASPLPVPELLMPRTKIWRFFLRTHLWSTPGGCN